MNTDVEKMSVQELEALLESKRESERKNRLRQKEAYEGIRSELVHRIKMKVMQESESIHDLFNFIQEECEAFYKVMVEYGQLRYDNQQSYTIQDETFKIEVKSNKVKKFDERADIAASRLIDFLNEWMQRSEKGTNDPMYQLAMTLLERNKVGELDYKSISKLYELEDQFGDPEYTEIMQLFRESNIVLGNAVNYYFSRKTERGVWIRIELSFNRL
jgi:hypothetical protein